MTIDAHPIFAALKACPIVPVLTLYDENHAASLAAALWDAGITTAEITLRTPQALPSIGAMKAAAPELCVGAGTILSVDDLNAALEAGSDFIVTPAVSSKLLPALKAVSVPVFPGVATPSEALELYDHGFECVKFFPAESNGGVPALKSMASPLPKIKFMPTGGINGDSAPHYLALPNVIAVGGSWMVDQQAVNAQNWASVKATALRARESLQP
ncbi:MAG: keto-deoxy-phosphogluconate aldolase [Robiginitomaculum sp.]|nr:MAG: keto-deoxy-phosphogluconate aldolase [Robiginitomaculum sp.]